MSEIVGLSRGIAFGLVLFGGVFLLTLCILSMYRRVKQARRKKKRGVSYAEKMLARDDLTEDDLFIARLVKEGRLDLYNHVAELMRAINDYVEHDVHTRREDIELRVVARLIHLRNLVVGHLNNRETAIVAIFDGNQHLGVLAERIARMVSCANADMPPREKRERLLDLEWEVADSLERAIRGVTIPDGIICQNHLRLVPAPDQAAATNDPHDTNRQGD